MSIPVIVGQVWIDCDKRLQPGRRFRIERVIIGTGLVECVNLASGKKTRISISRLKPGPTGYRLETPAAPATAEIPTPDEAKS